MTHAYVQSTRACEAAGEYHLAKKDPTSHKLRTGTGATSVGFIGMNASDGI